MTKTKLDIDRSLAFTALLEIPAFRALEGREGERVVTAFLADWYQAPDTDMYRYAMAWAEASEILREAPARDLVRRAFGVPDIEPHGCTGRDCDRCPGDQPGTAEDVEICLCSNEALERGESCGDLACPNGGAR